MKNTIYKYAVPFLCICIMFSSCFNIICRAEAASTKQETPKTPSPVKVKRYSDTSLRLKWKKVKKADGYVVYKYKKSVKKYKPYEIIKGKENCTFIDVVGKHKIGKYKVSAYVKKGKKRILSPPSYSVSARTYMQGDKKVNAGKVKSRVVGDTYYQGITEDLAFYETLKLTSKIKPSKFSKASKKKPLSTKVRWHSSNKKIAKVDKNGLVTAGGTVGKCYIYTRAHNGNRSNKILINVVNYAKPDKKTLNLGTAWSDSDRYGAVLEMFQNYYQAVTDIAEYFYKNRPKADETFKCWMEDGEVKMSPENYVNGKIKQDIYNFIKDFPYEISLYVTPGMVNFTELHGTSEENKIAGAIIVFKYDKNKSDPHAYDEKYILDDNWTYGFFAAI